MGLGNPGSKYERPRHNAGFDVVTILAKRLGISVRVHDYKARLGKGKIGDKDVLLVMPQTYMNNSGQSVKEMMRALSVSADKLIVVYDDMDLEVGTVRVKEQGSAGTHNGMKSIVFSLLTDEFVRVRVGIGKPEGETVDYVLGEHSDKQAAFDALKKAADAIEAIVTDGVKEAQNSFN